MDKPEDHGGGQPTNPYCKYCTDEEGNLLPKGVVREKMIQFQMKLGKSQDQAERETDELMARMPAWKDEKQPPGGEASVSPPQPVGEEAASDLTAISGSSPGGSVGPSEPAIPGGSIQSNFGTSGSGLTSGGQSQSGRRVSQSGVESSLEEKKPIKGDDDRGSSLG